MSYIKSSKLLIKLIFCKLTINNKQKLLELEKMFAKNLMVLVLISLLMLTNAQQTNERLNELRSLQQSALRSLQQTDDADSAATSSKCTQSMSKLYSFFLLINLMHYF